MTHPSVVKIRIFGSDTCKDCVKQKKAMEIYSVGFDFINTDDVRNDTLCDEQNIEDLPCLQAFRIETGEVILQRTGYVPPSIFLRDLSSKLEEINSSVNLNLKGVRSSNAFSIQPTKNIEGCNGCTNESKNYRSE